MMTKLVQPFPEARCKKRRYKRLPVHSFVEHLVLEYEGRRKIELAMFFRSIVPVFWRDGLYFDRQTGRVWQERRGWAFEENDQDAARAMFKYDLMLMEAQRFTALQRAMIKALCLAGVLKTKEWAEALMLDAELRCRGRQHARACMSLRAFLKRRANEQPEVSV